MNIANSYGNFELHAIASRETTVGYKKSVQLDSSLEGTTKVTFQLIGNLDFLGTPDSTDELDLLGEHADSEFSAEDWSELDRLLGFPSDPSISEKETLNIDDFLEESSVNPPTENDHMLSRVVSTTLTLDAIEEQKYRGELESKKSTFDKLKEKAQIAATKVSSFFQSKPLEGVKTAAEAGMSGISGVNSVAKQVSSALIEAGSAVSVALPGVGAVLGLAEIAQINQKIEVLENRLVNLQHILQDDIPNIPINKSDPAAVADLKKLEDGVKYAISQLESRKMMLGIVLGGAAASTVGASVVMLSGATGVGAAVGAGIGIAGSAAKQIPLAKRVVRYAYKKATSTLGVERSFQAEALISSVRHWNPGISASADKVLLHLGATKKFHETHLSVHHEGPDSHLSNEKDHQQVKAIIERKLRSFP